jgi:hypothetical protein
MPISTSAANIQKRRKELGIKPNQQKQKFAIQPKPDITPDFVIFKFKYAITLPFSEFTQSTQALSSSNCDIKPKKC